MASDFKVKTLRIQNLDKIDETDLDKEIRKELEKQTDAGYTLKLVGGGDAFIVLIFQKV